MHFPGSSVVSNMPAKQETWVRCLGQEDPLEKEMATHSSILAWKIPWTLEHGGLVHGVAKESDALSASATLGLPPLMARVASLPTLLRL